MGEGKKPALRVRFDRRVQVEFRGATLTSDAGLRACQELDDSRGLTEMATTHLKENRTGRNIQHQLVPLLRKSVYSRLAGYEDTNPPAGDRTTGPRPSHEGYRRMARFRQMGRQHQYPEPV